MGRLRPMWLGARAPKALTPRCLSTGTAASSTPAGPRSSSGTSSCGDLKGSTFDGQVMFVVLFDALILPFQLAFKTLAWLSKGCK